MKKAIHILPILLVLFFFACNHKSQETLFTTIFKTNSGDIRGINLNSTPNKVIQIEGKKPDSTADEYLAYFINYPEKQAKIKIEYNFDNSGLYSVDINVKINGDSAKSIATIDTLQNKIKKFLTKKYGTPEKLTPQTFLWSFRSVSGSLASAQLINNSKIDGTGSLELIVQTEVE